MKTYLKFTIWQSPEKGDRRIQREVIYPADSFLARHGDAILFDVGCGLQSEYLIKSPLDEHWINRWYITPEEVERIISKLDFL